MLYKGMIYTVRSSLHYQGHHSIIKVNTTLSRSTHMQLITKLGSHYTQCTTLEFIKH